MAEGDRPGRGVREPLADPAFLIVTGGPRTDPDQLLARVRALAAGRPRVVLGLAGPPAAGKSTLAAWLARRLTTAGLAAVVVPMDGFHLADVALDALGRRDRKGAADTFDGAGYRALLARLRAETDEVVYAPAFERDLEQPLAGAIAVGPEVRVVVSEGNYLLLREAPWPSARACCDEVWYVDLGDSTRRDRLIARHERFGRSAAAARAWAATVDEPNAAQIAATAGDADLRLDLSGVDLRDAGG